MKRLNHRYGGYAVLTLTALILLAALLHSLSLPSNAGRVTGEELYRESNRRALEEIDNRRVIATQCYICHS